MQVSFWIHNFLEGESRTYTTYCTKYWSCGNEAKPFYQDRGILLKFYVEPHQQRID